MGSFGAGTAWRVRVAGSSLPGSSGLVAQSSEELAGRTWTAARWLRYWLTTRTAIRPTRLRVYTHGVETHLIPAIGDVKLAALTSRHLTAMMAELAAGTTLTGQPRSAARLQRIRATLRAAYNAAIREGMVVAAPKAGSATGSRPSPPRSAGSPTPRNRLRCPS